MAPADLGLKYIIINRQSDFAQVDVIDVASAQVTGWGTNTITINPSHLIQEQTIILPSMIFLYIMLLAIMPPVLLTVQYGISRLQEAVEIPPLPLFSLFLQQMSPRESM